MLVSGSAVRLRPELYRCVEPRSALLSGQRWRQGWHAHTGFAWVVVAADGFAPRVPLPGSSAGLRHGCWCFMTQVWVIEAR